LLPRLSPVARLQYEFRGPRAEHYETTNADDRRAYVAGEAAEPKLTDRPTECTEREQQSQWRT